MPPASCSSWRKSLHCNPIKVINEEWCFCQRHNLHLSLIVDLRLIYSHIQRQSSIKSGIIVQLLEGLNRFPVNSAAIHSNTAAQEDSWPANFRLVPAALDLHSAIPQRNIAKIKRLRFQRSPPVISTPHTCRARRLWVVYYFFIQTSVPSCLRGSSRRYQRHRCTLPDQKSHLQEGQPRCLMPVTPATGQN